MLHMYVHAQCHVCDVTWSTQDSDLSHTTVVSLYVPMTFLHISLTQ